MIEPARCDREAGCKGGAALPPLRARPTAPDCCSPYYGLSVRFQMMGPHRFMASEGPTSAYDREY